MANIEKLYERYFEDDEMNYITSNAYDSQIFYNLFSQVGYWQIDDMFVFMMAQQDFTKEDISLMISLGVNVNNLESHADNLLTNAKIDNLVRLANLCPQVIGWKFADKNVNPIRIRDFLQLCNDIFFRILLNTGYAFSEILFNLMSFDKTCQPFYHCSPLYWHTWHKDTYFTNYLSAKSIDFIIEKIALYWHNIDSLILSNLLYCLMLNVNRELTLVDINQFIQFGADPRYNNDSLFIRSCQKLSPDIILFFLNDCGCDINAQNSEALIEAANNCPSNIKLLLELGINITDDFIEILPPDLLDTDFIDMMAKYGANMELIAKKTIRTRMPYQRTDSFKKLVQCLINIGIDFNKVLTELN